MNIRQKLVILSLSGFFLTAIFCFFTSTVSVSAAPEKKCFYHGPLIGNKVGTTAFDCRSFREQYVEIVGDDFRGFNPNKCYIIHELPGDPPTAGEIDCDEARRMVNDTDDEEVNEPDEISDPCSETAIIDVDCSGNNNPIISLLLVAINVMAALVGLAAVGGFIYGAILYTSAGDKAAQVTKAKETLANVVIGLVAFALMWAFLQFLIPGGVFNRDYSPPASTAPAPPRDDDTGNNNNDDNDTRNGVRLSDINLRNLRDAAATTNGNILKRGVLYRSSELANLNGANQPKKLGQLLGRNAIIIDVRPENSPPDKTIPGVRRINIPISGWTDQVDVAVTDPARRSGLGRVLKTMASADGPVLLHCVAGKDRTGWLAAMIMHANGANDAQVMKEYMKSTDANFLVKREWLNTGLSAARREYGSIPNYMKRGLGLNDNDLRKLRQKFGA